MAIPLSIQAVDSTNLGLLKELLAAEDLPTQDLSSDMKLFFSPSNQGILTCGGYEQYGKIGLLRSVAIHPDSQGKGLGTEWMKLLLEKAQELGLEEVYLLTTTAEGFFQKIGFSKISRDNVPLPIQQSEEFSSLCPSSAVVMCLKLSQS